MASRLWAQLKRSSAGAFGSHVSRYAWATLTWVPIIVFINDNVFEITSIRGPSMSPFFNERHNETTASDVCLTWKWKPQRDLHRGQIVTFRWVPRCMAACSVVVNSYRNPLNPDALTTKRIVGLPDDIVHTRPPFPNQYIRVPPYHVWVEGDEGGKLTMDSNTYGPISMQLIEGHITHVLWPWRKAGRVKWWEHPDRLAVWRQ